MAKGFRLSLLILTGFLGLLGPALAQSTDAVDERIETVLGGGDSFPVAFEVLQQAVGAGDAATVAALIDYPLSVTIDGERVTLTDEEAFVEHYDAVMTPQVAEAVTGQAYGDLFVNGEGVMFGDGEVWMSPFCTDSSCAATYWLVIAINTPG